MSRRAARAVLLLVLLVLAASCGGTDRARSGVLIVDRMDAGESATFGDTRVYLQVAGAAGWKRARVQDGTVRLELPAGRHHLRTELRSGKRGDTLAACEHTIAIAAGAARTLRAQLAADGDSCTWQRVANRDTLEPPELAASIQHGPGPAWIESAHGAVVMQAGSSCWSRRTGPGLGVTGCADSVGPNCTTGTDLPYVSPLLDAEPGELVTIHLPLAPATASVDLAPSVLSRAPVKPSLTRGDGGRALRFAAPDDDATLMVFIRADGGDASWYVCLQAIADTDASDRPTRTRAAATAGLTEQRARRTFDIDNRGGGFVPIPGTLECAKADRPDLADGAAWKCSTLLGEAKAGRVARFSGYVVRADAGVVERASELVAAPRDLPHFTEATLEGVTGAVELQRAVAGTRPSGCDGPDAPPTLRAYVGDTFSARIPFRASAASLTLDDDPTVGAPPRPAQPHPDGRVLTTTLLKPRLRFVTVAARTASGVTAWYGCLDPITDPDG